MDEFADILLLVCRRYLTEKDFMTRIDLKFFCRDYYEHSASPVMSVKDFNRKLHEMNINENDIPELCNTYAYLFYAPAEGEYVIRDLKHMCRLAVLRQVTLAEKGGVNVLPIPRMLKLYLQYEA